VAGTARTRVVLTRVLVVSVGTAPAGGPAIPSTTTAPATASSTTASGQGSTLVTLAVNQADAERLIQLTETGMPYLALLTSTSRTTTDAGRLLNVLPKPRPTLSLPVVTPSPTPTLPVPTPSPTKTR
jgi:pilus assembly protein CpaB